MDDTSARRSGPADAIELTGGGGSLVEWLTGGERRLDGLKDPDAVAAAAADLAVPRLADIAIIALPTAEPAGGTVATVAAADPRLAAQAHRLLEDSSGALDYLTAIVTRGERLRWRWLPDLDENTLSLLGRHEPALPSLVTALHLTSAIILPLRAGGRPLGLMLLGCTGRTRRLGGREFAVAQVLARRTALALDGAADATTAPARPSREHRIHELEGRWAHLFQHARWGAGLLDAEELRFEAANAALARMHGLSDPAELIGRPVVELVPGEMRAEVERHLRHAADEPVTYEALHRRGSHGRVPVLVTLTPIHDPDDGVRSVMLQVQDLSELRRTEERLERAQRLEAIGQLAGGVAHEVNNMMTVVLGFADLMLASRDLPPAHREDAEEIRRAAERVSSITRQLLAFSRRQTLHADVLAVNEVVEAAGQLFRPLLPANIVLETRLEAEGCYVRSDRVQLEQVLVNLAFNARDAMAQGGRLTIATRSYHREPGASSPISEVEVPSGDYCLIEVIDDGVGMDADTQARIFEPFFTTKRVGEGTGLGLATVYGIVKQSGGYVWVRSERGRGTCFTVCLPATDAAAVGAAPGSREPERGGHETILIAEDEPSVRTLAARVLQDAGFRVIAAADGLEALDLVAAGDEPVDLVLTDLVMPDLSGRLLRDRIAEVRADLPVVFMSAYTSEEAEHRGWLPAGEPVLQKPFTREALIGAVRAALDARGRVVSR
jgi:hypothetical protein